MKPVIGNCPDCGGAVSRNAESCPHCGSVFVPTKKSHSVLYYVVAVLFWLFIIFVVLPWVLVLMGVGAGSFLQARKDAQDRAAHKMSVTNAAQEEFTPKSSSVRATTEPTPEDVQAQRKAREEEKTILAKAKVLKFQIDLAERHDAYGELCMGRRYAAGDGVQKDSAMAKVYFIRAATHGSTEAEGELQKLESSSAK